VRLPEKGKDSVKRQPCSLKTLSLSLDNGFGRFNHRVKGI
jgi:hypothetical protein